MYFSYLEPVCSSMPSSNCCFPTCIQFSQEAGQVVWSEFYSFFVIHTVKGFGIVNKAEIDVFLILSCFSIIQWILAIWSLVPLPFLKPAWTSESLQFTLLLKPSLENFEHYFTSMWGWLIVDPGFQMAFWICIIHGCIITYSIF